MPTKLQRHLDLIAYLVGRRLPVAVDELLERIPAYGTGDSARRMFERDKDDLRRAGIPLKTIKYSIEHGAQETEGYVIERRDFYLPYLKLVSEASTERRYQDKHRPSTVEITEADAPLALQALLRVASVPSFPLVNEAKSAFRKLAFDIDPDAFTRSPAVVFADKPHDAETADALRVIADATLRKKRVRFRYKGIYKGDDTQRDVAGYGLLFQSGQWYLIGHDALRDDIRVFRVSRMHDVVPNKTSPNTPDYEVPADFSLNAYVGRQAWELGDVDEQPITARVLFRFPTSLWAERNGHGVAESTRADGSVVRLFTVHQVNPFLRWLLGMQTDVEVLDPPEFQAELRAMAQRVAQQHMEAIDAGR